MAGSNDTFAPSVLQRFCFTLNNPERAELGMLANLPEGWSYLVWQLERGENGTEHVQGYAELKKRTKFQTVKRQLPRAHIEKARGTPQQCKAYCTKEDSRIEAGMEIGTMRTTKQGQRTDLQGAFDVWLKEGEEACIDQHLNTYARYHRGLEKAVQVKAPERTWKTEVWWITGPTGAGKSHYAFSLANEASCAVKPDQVGWFDGYHGEEDYLWDELSEKEDLTTLLRCMDKYKLTVPVKGGFAKWRVKRLFITSTMTPRSWAMKAGHWKRLPELCRRIDHLVLCEVSGSDGGTIARTQTEIARVHGTGAETERILSFEDYEYTH